MSVRLSFVLLASLAGSIAACGRTMDTPDASSVDAGSTADHARTDAPIRDDTPSLDAAPADDAAPALDAPAPTDSYRPDDAPTGTDVSSQPDARDAAPAPHDAATDATRFVPDGGGSCAANAPCDPLTQAGCAAGETCYPVYASAAFTGTECLPTGHVAAGRSCATDNDCVQGYTCMLHLVCMRLCDPARGGLHSSECTGSSSGGPNCDTITTGVHGPDSCFGICQNGYTGG